MRRFLIAAAALLLAALPCSLEAAGPRRAALVIGQSAYKGGHAATVGLAPLKNPRNDAVAPC